MTSWWTDQFCTNSFGNTKSWRSTRNIYWSIITAKYLTVTMKFSLYRQTILLEFLELEMVKHVHRKGRILRTSKWRLYYTCISELTKFLIGPTCQIDKWSQISRIILTVWWSQISQITLTIIGRRASYKTALCRADDRSQSILRKRRKNPFQHKIQMLQNPDSAAKPKALMHLNY